MTAWGARPPAPPAQFSPLGVSVGLELEGADGGRVNVDLHFGPEYAASLDALEALVGELLRAGFPVKVWRQKKDDGGRGRGFDNGGGYRGRGRSERGGGW